MNFPSQTLPLKEKTVNWYKLHLSYAEDLLKNYSPAAAKMTRLMDSYNGVKLPGSLEWLEKNYGKQNKSKYIAYRLGRSKISLLHGEWLKRPLSTTVSTINHEAVSAKMHQYDMMVGAMLAKPELTDLKDKAGVDVMEGAPIPDSPEDPIWQKMSFKDKYEDTMQIIADNQVRDLDAKKKFADGFLNVLLTNRVWVQIERDETGEIQMHNIDPRDAICEEIQGDDFYEKSPIRGCRRSMPIHEILLRYNLTKEQRDLLEKARNDQGRYCGSDGLSRGYMRMSNGELIADVIHIEWDSVTPEYYKRVKKTASQAMLDDENDSDTMDLEMDPIKYESNKEFHDANVQKGLYEIVIKYRGEELEATRIGGILDINMRRTYFQKRSVDKPAHILSSSYFGWRHGIVNGTDIPLQQSIENLDNLFDVNMYQLLKDLARAKGIVLTYDRAGLPVNRTLKDVMYQAANDQFIDYDSSAAGNVGQRTLDQTNAFKSFDLGLSQSFQFLMALKNDIINMMNQLTGINESREGNTLASTTATNAQTDISNSRTITESLFFGMNMFTNKVMKGIIDSSAISWAFYKLEKGEQILGADKFKFMQLTRDIGYQDYGVVVEDGGKYMEIRNDIKNAAQISLNAKEIRTVDYLNTMTAETVAQMSATLRNAWIEMQKMAAQQNQANNDAMSQQQQQALQTQLQIAKDDRDAKEANEQQNIILKGQVQMKVDDNKSKNDMFKDNMNNETDLLNGLNP